MEICLIRHTAVNVPAGLCYGQSEVPLKETFEQEWSSLQLRLSGIRADAIFTSPLKRCEVLAKRVSTHYNLRFTPDDRLKELHFGDWESRRWDEIDRSASDFWMDDYMNRRCPGGESYSDLIDRVKNFLDDVNKQGVANPMIVTHAGVIRVVMAIVNNVDFMEVMDRKVGFGEVINIPF